MSRGWLTAYLRQRLKREGAEATHVVKFPRGSSRETWFVEFRESEGAPTRKVVFRADLPSGSTIPSPLDQEYGIYERLGRTKVPVAKVLWWEDDPQWSMDGRPFFVREQVEGSWNVPNFHSPDPAYDELRIEVSKEHMRKLALVHNVDWRALGFDRILPAPPSEAACGHNMIDAMVRRFEQFRLEAIPIFLEGAEFLRDRAPAAPRIVLCKGTNGLGEEIFQGRTIVAMSDWEEASLGDPAADFASLQDFTPEIVRDGRTIWGLEHSLAYYREVSGIDLPLENVRFYQMLRALSTIGFSANAARGVTD
ncbi:MAG TPA: phosphotransferase family protein, partial [Nevskiaceae bacterium]|nr:phosphotransferase family protein [Nevskiaceae bacterium]